MPTPDDENTDPVDNNANVLGMGMKKNVIKKPPKKSMPPPPPMMWNMDPALMEVQMSSITTFHPDLMYCGACSSNDKVGDEKKIEANPVQDLEDFQEDGGSDNSDDEEYPVNHTQLVLSKPLTCSSHNLLIQSLLLPIKGVKKVIVNLEKSEISVEHDAQVRHDELATVLNRGGYPAAAIDTDNNTASKDESKPLVRSQLHVKGICCYSEVPAIRKIIKPIPGVEKLQVNVTTKMVYVHHDHTLVTAEFLTLLLKSEGFPSRVIKDGGINPYNEDTSQGTASRAANVGRTTLHVKGVLTERDISTLQRDLAGIPGVSKIGVNVAESVIFVDHDVTKITATELTTHIPQHSMVVARDAESELEESKLKVFSQSKSQYFESTLLIPNLTFSHVRILQKAIRQNTIRAQVRAIYPHVPTHTAKIEHNPDLLSINKLIPILEKYGLEASVLVDGAEENLVLPMQEDFLTETEDEDGLWGVSGSKLQFNVILSGIFWFLSMMSAVGGIWHYLEYAGLLSVFFGLPPVAKKAFRTLRRRQFDANCMMVTAALGALVLQEFDEAASVAFLFALSEFLEERSTVKARKALNAIVNLRPEHTSVIHPTTKEIFVVATDQVPTGSLLSVRTGDKVAADGVVVEGSSTVDESSLTGESVPISKKVGDAISGGCINVGTTQLVVKTTTSVENSAMSRLIRLVEEAQINRSPTEKMIDSFAKSYTPFVISMAFVMCTIPWFFGAEVGRYWTLNGLIIIVIACPCALTISTPMTYAAGLAAAAQRGVIVKGGVGLEALGSVNTVIFDKTGTLTQGQFHVNHLKEIGETRTRTEMLELLILMEAPSSHPLSATLVKAARQEGVKVPTGVNLSQHTVLKGEGVTAVVDDKQVYVGNKRLFERIGMFEQLPVQCKVLADEWSGQGGTVGFLGVEGEGIIGIFSMTDTIRPEAKAVIKDLEKGGMTVKMLTGDSDGAAKAIAKEVGLHESLVHSELLPEDKLHFVGSLVTPNRAALCNRASKVLFCGDGVNDGPALAAANVGVSMGEGAALAMEVSDITLMDSNLTKLVYVLKLGVRVVMTIQENIFMSLLAKLVVVCLTFAGKMTLFAAIASDVGVMLLVTLNGMRLLPGTEEDGKTARRFCSVTKYEKIPLVNQNHMAAQMV